VPELQTRPARDEHDSGRDQRDDRDDPQHVQREADAAEDQGDEQERDEESDHAPGLPAAEVANAALDLWVDLYGAPPWGRPTGPLALLDPRARSLGCAGCGACCEQIILSWDPRESPTPFVRERWHVEWVVEKLPPTELVPDAPAVYRGTYYVVTCDAYDPERRSCTAYDDRPQVCSGYPFYGDAPREGYIVDHGPLYRDGAASCSFWLDVPGWSSRGARPLLPLTVVR
jgi:Fe-S-cluster containining protein